MKEIKKLSTGGTVDADFSRRCRDADRADKYKNTMDTRVPFHYILPLSVLMRISLIKRLSG